MFMDIMSNDGWIGLFKKSLKGDRRDDPGKQDAKLRFISGVNHELRGPINGINGLIWLLETTELNEEQKKYLASLRHSSDEMLRILYDTVDMARLEQGEFPVKNEEVQVSPLINDVLTSFIMPAASRKLLLHSHVAHQLETSVHCDPQRLKQVINGALLYLVKSLCHGELLVKCQVTEENFPKLRLEFSETTKGIPHEVLLRFQAMTTNLTMDSRYDEGPLGHAVFVAVQVARALRGHMGVDLGQTAPGHIWAEIPVKSILARQA